MKDALVVLKYILVGAAVFVLMPVWLPLVLLGVVGESAAEAWEARRK